MKNQTAQPIRQQNRELACLVCRTRSITKIQKTYKRKHKINEVRNPSEAKSDRQKQTMVEWVAQKVFRNR